MLVPTVTCHPRGWKVTWFPTVTCAFSGSRARGTNIVRHSHMVSHGHVCVLRVTCEGDEHSSSQVLTLGAKGSLFSYPLKTSHHCSQSHCGIPFFSSVLFHVALTLFISVAAILSQTVCGEFVVSYSSQSCVECRSLDPCVVCSLFD